MTFHVTDPELDWRIDSADVTGWWRWIRNTKETQGKNNGKLTNRAGPHEMSVATIDAGNSP